MPLSERAERITKEHVEDMLLKTQEIADLAKSGGDNLQHFLQSRCSSIQKLLKEIQEKV